MLGAPVEQDTPLCATCLRFVRYAIGSLHVDLADLTTLMEPSMEVRHRDPDLPDQPRVKLSAPLPWGGRGEHAEGIRAAIVNEVTEWAEAVTDATGGTWDPEWVESVRDGYRVQHLAGILAEHTLFLVTLPPARRRLYSTGVDPAAGRDDVETYQGAAWAMRDGAEAALTFLRLHEQVRAVAGRIPSDRIPLPCPRCWHKTLHREHHKAMTDSFGQRSEGRVVCRNTHCWGVWADHEYAEMRTAAARAFGIPL